MLRASSANLKSGTDPWTSSRECQVATEILSLSIEVPTDDVCLAEVGTTLSDFDVEASCLVHVLEVLSDCFGPGAVKQSAAARDGARSALDHRLPVSAKEVAYHAQGSEHFLRFQHPELCKQSLALLRY
ncbi:unnamed protein product [Polarella glacialis]|uniref:Uncharacterized protein n=1 Tax=Polarella glacialis TaxID=89957 RepID=A0A813FXT3_POLGL|nr:unnamed protein product [Polarella glacialis]